MTSQRAPGTDSRAKEMKPNALLYGVVLMQAEGTSRRDASSGGAFAHAHHTWSRVIKNRHEMR
jgi:hypothetical protein